MKFQESDLVRSRYTRAHNSLPDAPRDYDVSRSLGIVLKAVKPNNDYLMPVYVVEWLSDGATGVVEHFGEVFLEKAQ